MKEAVIYAMCGHLIVMGDVKKGERLTGRIVQGSCDECIEYQKEFMRNTQQMFDWIELALTEGTDESSN